MDGGEVAQADAEAVPAVGPALVVVGRAVEADELARSTATDLEADTQERDEVSFLGRLQSFFAITSWGYLMR